MLDNKDNSKETEKELEIKFKEIQKRLGIWNFNSK